MKIILLLFLVLHACEEPVDWTIEPVEPFLSVDGMITSDPAEQDVVLTRLSADPNGPFTPVSGAMVAVSDGDSIWLFNESPVQPGHYRPPRPFPVLINKVYFLYINEQGNEYTAATSAVPVTPLAPYNIQPAGDSLYQLVPAESDIPAMKEYYLDWSGVPGYDTLPEEQTHAFLRHYTLQNIDANSLFKPGAEEVFFPRGTKIIRKKYSITPDYQEYLRALLSETAWRGSIFDVLPGNLPGNIRGGATGYFTASTVVSDSIVW